MEFCLIYMFSVIVILCGLQVVERLAADHVLQKSVTEQSYFLVSGAQNTRLLDTFFQ